MRRSETYSKVYEFCTHSPANQRDRGKDTPKMPEFECGLKTAQHLNVRNINKQAKVIIKFTCCANENDLETHSRTFTHTHTQK